MKLKKLTQKDRYGNTMSYEFEGDTKQLDPTRLMEKQMEMMNDFEVPEMMEVPAYDHPGEPRGSDTVPAWLTPGEFVVNAEAMRIPGAKETVEHINNRGREIQRAQGGSIPQGYHMMPDGSLMAGETHMNNGGRVENIPFPSGFDPYFADGGNIYPSGSWAKDGMTHLERLGDLLPYISDEDYQTEKRNELLSYEDPFVLQEIKKKMQADKARALAEGIDVKHDYMSPEEYANTYGFSGNPHDMSPGGWHASWEEAPMTPGTRHAMGYRPYVNIPGTPSLANQFVAGEEYAHARGADWEKAFADKETPEEFLQEEYRAKQQAMGPVTSPYGRTTPNVESAIQRTIDGYEDKYYGETPHLTERETYENMDRLWDNAWQLPEARDNFGWLSNPQYRADGGYLPAGDFMEAPMMAPPPAEVVAEAQADAPVLQGFNSLEDLLAEREGFRDSIYLDSLGKPTIGYGRLIEDAVWDPSDARIGSKPYSKEQLEQFKKDDIKTAAAAAEANIGKEAWDKLSVPQQWALTSQAFQLGGKGQSKFKKMIEAIQAGDFDEAAHQAYDSKWYGQTPKRTHDLAMAFSPNVRAQYKADGGWLSRLFGGTSEDIDEFSNVERDIAKSDDPYKDMTVEEMEAERFARTQDPTSIFYDGPPVPHITGAPPQVNTPELDRETGALTPAVSTGSRDNPGTRGRSQGLPSALAMEQAREERAELEEQKFQSARERIAEQLPPIHNYTQADLDRMAKAEVDRVNKELNIDDTGEKDFTEQSDVYKAAQENLDRELGQLTDNEAPPLPADQTPPPPKEEDEGGVLGALKAQQKKEEDAAQYARQERERMHREGRLPSEAEVDAIGQQIKAQGDPTAAGQEIASDPENEPFMSRLMDDLKSEFQDVFSTENLSHLAVRAAGAMAFGTPPMQAIQWAAGSALQDQAAREKTAAADTKTRTQQATTLIGQGFSPESAQKYVETGDVSVLQKAEPSKTGPSKAKLTSNNAFIPGQGRVNVYEVDGIQVYYDKNKNPVPIANNPNAQIFDKSTMGNKAVTERFTDDIKSYVRTLNEGLEEKDAFRVDNSRIANQANRIFQEDLKGANLPVESAEELRYQIGESTREYIDAMKKYRDAVKADPDQTEVLKPTSLEAFHSNRMISLKAGILPSELEGTEAKQMRGINNTLNSEGADAVAVWENAKAAWDSMSEDEKSTYDKTPPGYSRFTYFVRRLADDDKKTINFVERARQ